MADAAERAAQVIRNGFRWNGRGFDAFSPEDAVAALMADPDLLVDLAIEAGGLEHARNHKYPQEGAYHAGTFVGWIDDEEDEYGRVADEFYRPLYRRVVDRG